MSKNSVKYKENNQKLYLKIKYLKVKINEFNKQFEVSQKNTKEYKFIIKKLVPQLQQLKTEHN